MHLLVVFDRDLFTCGQGCRNKGNVGVAAEMIKEAKEWRGWVCSRTGVSRRGSPRKFVTLFVCECKKLHILGPYTVV